MAENEQTKGDWVITPGLKEPVEDFIRLYEHLKDNKDRKYPRPIMILGEPGVGKSLFWRIYRELYKKDNEKAKPKKIIKRINVAAIPETLIASELFGYVKGAFTDARKEGKPGIVKEVDLLILEEIGDLLPEVQAKLLTFLEDHEYYPVGATEPTSANEDLQIITTTNKKKGDMRQDFYDRFVKFTVPPLYKRRQDVLYYISHFSSDLLKHFYPWEIMTLLAHPWPGNVREIELACLDLELHHLRAKEDAWRQVVPSFHFIKKDHSEIKFETCDKLYRSLEGAGVDVKLLESVLNQLGLGLDQMNKKKPLMKNGKRKFHSSGFTDEEKVRDKLLGTQTLAICPEYEMFEMGLLLFGILFYKSVYDEKNLLAVGTGKLTIPMSDLSKIFTKLNKPVHDRLVLDIWEYVTNIKLPEDKKKSILDLKPSQNIKWYPYTVGRPRMNTELNEPGTDGPGREAKEPQKNPFDLTEKELLKVYYGYLLKKAGTKKGAAALADLNEKTFHSRLANLGIP